ncbi:flagellar biosynthetic protein FliR [Pseudomonas fragi]|jgi:flagellar biosynthesis protein FliR|uniref:Flagellar biosynthetic protein FliR n=1 Tax=Pseudomonas fragi TaxID=296 RepID=A0A9Q5AX30_PSEFR|nr:flagellar biosynthetic protein FliR [Pseudomonas fragi]MBM1198464.1 flagellar biosynthetic protein FliR [Pseudomonas fragi]NNB27820.1 flagellar biosynthetic protein FliR [Pseudomonas fragi]NNB35260.1 flagellar biosynthetic protein FliR [Pseudomonas fragi]NNB47984.1 flagellar biosynthetic protein FliR [Pseudomonas fragi]PAA07877.1 flagellar biosynthetic protein FliR [Pseudomonas fragi]
MNATEPLLQASQYLHTLQGYWWPFCRLLAVFSMAPLFNHKAMSKKLRVLLALVVTAAIGGALPPMPQVNPLSAEGALLALEQIAFGLILGLCLQLVFTVFSVVGEVVSAQMGMTMARYNDPVNGVSSSSIVYQLYFVLLVFLFLSIDGHLLTLSVLFKSFSHWPVGSGLNYQSYTAFMQAIAWVFSAAVLLTLPMVFCVVLVQFCFGLLNRISPSMNLFSLGFPITILVGLLCIYMTLPNLPENYLHLTRELLDNIAAMLEGGPDV